MNNKIKNKISVIAPNSSIAALAREIALEYEGALNIYEIYEGNLDEGVKAARQALSRGSEIIISRGGTALLIEKELKIPVICIVFSGVDLVKTVEKARLIDKKIALMGYNNLFGEISGGEYDFFGCKIYVEKLSEYSEIKEKIMRLHDNKNIKVYIGGEAVTKTAERLGHKGILIESGPESVRRAVQEAVRVAEMKLNESRRYLQFKAITEHSSEGIIFIDESKKIGYVNPIAQALFSQNIEKIIGRDFGEVIRSPKLEKAIKDGTPKLSIYDEVNETKIVANYIPLSQNALVFGAIISFQNVTKIEELEKKIRREQYSKGLVAKNRFEDILTRDPRLIHILDNARRIARADSSVLITGESGTGKELIAQSIHNASGRKHGPFVAVNCAALPESILESELFGYVDGAFTGARKSGKPGLFELAHMGTIFLDEIGDIPLTVQSHLLRVIQEKEVTRIGDDRVIPVNIRIISATNKDLIKMVKNGEFRDDLYYRLDVVKIKVPPLRERIEDIPFFCSYFIEHFCRVNKLKIKSISSNALDLLKAYSWPGNIRELQNFIESLVIICEDDYIDEHAVELLLKDKLDYNLFVNLKNDFQKNNDLNQQKQEGRGVLQKLEYQSIKEVLEQVQGDKVKAAQILGISTTTLWRRLKKINYN